MSSRQYYTPGPHELPQCMEDPQVVQASPVVSNAERAQRIQQAAPAAPVCEAPSPWGQSLATSARKPRKRRRGSSKQGEKVHAGGAKALDKAALATGAAVEGLKAVGEAGVRKDLVDAVVPESIGAAGSVAGATLGFGSHLLGDERIAESGVGHVVASGAKSGLEVANGKLVEHLAAKGATSNLAGTLKPQMSGGGALATSPWAALIAAADGVAGVENPAKAATSVVAAVDPATQLNKAASGGVDAAVAAGQWWSGNQAAAMRSAEVIDDKNVNGDYGVVPEALTKVVRGLGMDDKDIQNKSTDYEAKTGQRGFLSAVGNAGADGLESGYRGPTLQSAEDAMRERYEFNPLDPSTW